MANTSTDHARACLYRADEPAGETDGRAVAALNALADHKEVGDNKYAADVDYAGTE